MKTKYLKTLGIAAALGHLLFLVGSVYMFVKEFIAYRAYQADSFIGIGGGVMLFISLIGGAIIVIATAALFILCLRDISSLIKDKKSPYILAGIVFAVICFLVSVALLENIILIITAAVFCAIILTYSVLRIFLTV